MSLPVLGIDISKKKMDVALVVGAKTLDKVFDNTPKGVSDLIKWLNYRKIDKVHACLEATGTYGEEVAVALADAGHTVSVMNPARIWAFGQSLGARTKTDRVDARIIAQFCQTMVPEPWIAPSAEVRELREMVRCLGNLNEMLQMERNRLDAGVTSSEVTQILERNIAHLEAQIAQLERLIEDHIDKHPGLKEQRDLLVTIKGVGHKTANAFLAEIGEVSNFDSAREVAAYCGLSVREYVSGATVRGKARLSKVGNARLRAALYFPAVVAMTWNPAIHALAGRMRDRGKAKMAIVGAAMRKLLHQMFGVLKTRTPFNPTLNVN